MQYLFEYKEYTNYIYLTENIKNVELLNFVKSINNCTSLDELNKLEIQLDSFENINEGILTKIKDFVIDKKNKLTKWFTKNFLITKDDFQPSEEIRTKPKEEFILLNYILPFSKKDINYSIFNGNDATNYNKNFSDIFETYSVDSKFLDLIKNVNLLYVYKLWNPNSTSIEYVVHIYGKPREEDNIDSKMLKYEEIKSILPSIRILIKDPKQDFITRLEKYYKDLLVLNKNYKERIEDDIDFNKNYLKIAGKTIIMDMKNNNYE